MSKKTPVPKGLRRGSTTERSLLSASMSASSSTTVVGLQLSESQMGGNYLLQMEDLLPEQVIADDEEATSLLGSRDGAGSSGHTGPATATMTSSQSSGHSTGRTSGVPSQTQQLQLLDRHSGLHHGRVRFTAAAAAGPAAVDSGSNSQGSGHGLLPTSLSQHDRTATSTSSSSSFVASKMTTTAMATAAAGGTPPALPREESTPHFTLASGSSSVAGTLSLHFGRTVAASAGCVDCGDASLSSSNTTGTGVLSPIVGGTPLCSYTPPPPMPAASPLGMARPLSHFETANPLSPEELTRSSSTTTSDSGEEVDDDENEDKNKNVNDDGNDDNWWEDPVHSSSRSRSQSRSLPEARSSLHKGGVTDTSGEATDAAGLTDLSPPSTQGETEAASTPYAPASSPIQVPTIIVSALVMIAGFLLVALVGFAPLYVSGFKEVDKAFFAVQSQATSGLIRASSLPIYQLQQFVSVVLARCAATGLEGEPDFCLTAEEAKFSFASALSRQGFREVVAAMMYVRAEEGNDELALVTNFLSNGTVEGLLQTTHLSPNESLMYTLDPKRLTPISNVPAMRFNMTLKEAIYSERYAYHLVVLPWNKTFDLAKDARLKAYHTTVDAESFFAYFGLIVPIRSATGKLSFLGALLRSSSIMRLVDKNVMRSLRGSGRYFVVDPRTDLVLANSWDESLRAYSDISKYYSRLYPKDVTDPLAAAAIRQLRVMGYLGSREQTRGTEGRRERAKLPFGRDTAWVHAYNYVSSEVEGLNIVFAVVTLESDYFASVYKTRAILLSVIGVILVLFVLGAYLAASYVVGALNRLVPALTSGKDLRFSGGSMVTEGQLSVFTELLQVQLAYAQLQRQLMAVKPFLPGPLLVSAYEAEGSATAMASVGNSTNAIEPPVQGGDTSRQPSTTLTQSSVSPETNGNRNTNSVSGSQSEMVSTLMPGNPQASLSETIRISRKWHQDMRLNTKIFNEQVNVYQRRYCSVLFVSRYYKQDVDYGSLNRYFSACYAAAVEYNGCLEFLRPDWAVVTFGAHTQMAMHATRACQCALTIYDALPTGKRDQLNYLIDTNEFLVGTCGAQHGKKGRVVFDVAHLMSLIRVCRISGYLGVMATQATASHLPDYQSVPVDCVLEEVRGVPFVICEVREAAKGVSTAIVEQTAKRFRAAFHHMTKGKYTKALRIYRKIGPHDKAAVRLAEKCVQHLKHKDHNGLLTVLPYPRMRILHRLLMNKNLAPFLRVQCQYMAQLLGNGALFRPGHAPPLVMWPSPIEPSDTTFSSVPGVVAVTTAGSHPTPGSTADTAGTGTGAGTSGSPTRSSHSTERGKRAFSSSASPPLSATPWTSTEENAKVTATADGTGNPGRDGEEGGAPLGAVQKGEGSHSSGSSASHRRNEEEDEYHGGEDGEDGEGERDALFEWVDVASAGSLTLNAARSLKGSTGTHSHYAWDESLTVTDDNNCRWSRSVRAIGDGAFSVVYLGMSEDGVQVAIKRIPRRRRDIQEDNVRREIRTMAELHHRNIVQYIGFSATPAHLSIIMEYVPGGSLQSFICKFGKLDVTTARRFLLDILSGLAYLHERNIVHCDVKPHNVLLGMVGVCKLSDFGSTVSEAVDCAKSASGIFLRGTALYMAPEVARGERCTPESDIYSLGISLLEMLQDSPPWRWSSTAKASSQATPLKALFRSDARFVQLLSMGEIVPYIPESLGREVYGFCQACCQADPKNRPTAHELMSFPFIL